MTAKPLSPAQLKKIQTMFGKLGFEPEDKQGIISSLTNGRATSTKDITFDEAKYLINYLVGQAEPDKVTYQEQCRIFFRPAPITPENHSDVINTLYDSSYDQNNLIGIQPEPCLTPFFTGRLLHDILNHELPQAEKTLHLSEHAFQMNMNKIQNHQFCIYFTMEGLMQFARTGITAEIPEIFYHPLTPIQRIEVLNGVRDCCASGDYRMLQPPFNHLPQNLHFCIRGTMGSMIFRNNSRQIFVLNIEEPRLINIFRDYLENMNSSCYYSSEKSVILR